jgi:hypothetical protein
MNTLHQGKQGFIDRAAARGLWHKHKSEDPVYFDDMSEIQKQDAVNWCERNGLTPPIELCIVITFEESQTEKEPIMKRDLHFISIVRDDYYVAVVKFQNSSEKRYSYRVHESLQIEKGDYVVVDTSGRNGSNYGVCEVIDIKTADDLDLSIDVSYKWVVDKVDTDLIGRLHESDNNLLKVNESRERRLLREGLIGELTDRDRALLEASGAKLLSTKEG